MPYKLSGKTLPLDRPFEAGDIQYPANWLRLSTADDRDAIGIVWENDPASAAPYDQKFYTGREADGTLIPRDLAGLKVSWSNTTKQTANARLQPSDWRVIKAKERGSTLNADWKTWRQTIRTECGVKVTAIEGAADVAALAEYIRGSDYSAWTADPDNAAE